MITKIARAFVAVLGILMLCFAMAPPAVAESPPLIGAELVLLQAESPCAGPVLASATSDYERPLNLNENSDDSESQGPLSAPLRR